MTLLFGLSTGPFLFTKVLRLLMRYWRLHAIGIAYFLDDDIGIQFGISKFELTSKFLLKTLKNIRFISNK